MRRITVLTVCLLIVLAGCNAFSGGEDEGTTTTASGTIQPTTEVSAGETAGTTTETVMPTEGGDDADLPPGVSASGVTDAEALAAAHETFLAGQPYTYDREVRVVAADGTRLGQWGQHTQVGADRLRFNHTQTGEGRSIAGITIEDTNVYTNGSITYTYWNVNASEDRYWKSPGRGFAETTFSSEQLLADVLNASETSVTRVERDGRTWYRVRATEAAENFTYRPPNGTVTVNATNVTATALVAPSGFVRNVTYEFDFARGDVSGHRTMTVRYSAVGTTEVEVPSWVADAKEAIAEKRNETTEG